MPKFLEDKLRASAGKSRLKGKQVDRYVYGAMNNMGAMKGSKETAKGAAMDAKHERDVRKFRGESHEYDHRRPKKPVVSRYQ